MIQTGSCIYCGQTYQLEIEGTRTEEELNKIATQKCDCEDAKKAHESLCIQQKAEKAIEDYFRTDFPDTASILKAAILPIQANMIDSITVDTGFGIKGKVTTTSKGKIKVERTRTTKNALEI